MIKDNINDTIIKKLFSTDEKLILQGIEEIHKNGNSKYIPSLIELLYSQNNYEIEKNIISLLSEIKHKEAVAEFIAAIENPRYEKLLEVLLNCCWQNGLDFSDHLNIFAKLLINGDYMVAFEAYTVIQNTEGSITEEISSNIENILNEGLLMATDERRVLINDTLTYIKSLIN